MNITVRTRAQHMQLCERMLEFIPADVKRLGHTGYNTWKSAVTFLHDAIDRTEDILVVVDEDALLVDWEGVARLCRYVKDHDILYAGMPDGGIIDHRFHSYIHVNPFFAIFNCALINPVKKECTRDAIDATVFHPVMQRFRPDWLTSAYDHDNIEPFAGLFYWLASQGAPLLLKAATMEDGISTVVYGLEEEPLCYHSWYSRLYTSDAATTKRIDALYEKAVLDRSLKTASNLNG